MASSVRHAAIVAGGLGSRAHGLTGDVIPKALLPVAGVPILFRQLAVLAREGVTHVTVLAGHLGAQLAPALEAEARRLSLAVSVIVEKVPLGTAGCLTALPPGEDTLIVYGDMLFDLDLPRLAQAHGAGGAELTIVAHPNDHPQTSDLVVERGGLARAILPAKGPRGGDQRNLVPAGLYLATPAFFHGLVPDMKADMIHDELPKRIAAGNAIGVYNTPEYLRDVGTPARHAMAEDDIRSGRIEAQSLRHSRPAIFFDIDGVLNEEPGGHGVLSPDDVRLLPSAGAALRAARAAGFLAVGVTNRPQLAKGLLDEEGLQRIFGRLEALLAQDKAWLDRIYYCPHHPEVGHVGEVAALKIICDCRKPAPGLLEAAAHDLNIDLRRSVMIGDSPRDIGAAKAMNIKAYGVRTGAGFADVQPDALFDGVLDAVTTATAES
jgi:mannose-1-phosphate guanylyltransferase/phosphomannomutase